MLICYNSLYEKMFNRTKTILYCMLTWLTAPIINIFIIQLNDAYHFDEKTKKCMFNRTNRLLVSITSGCGNFIFFFFLFSSISINYENYKRNANMFIIVLFLSENI